MKPALFNIAKISLSLLFSFTSWAVVACEPRTPLEKVYCQLQEKNSAPPISMAEFRRNTPQVQALLLRRPAKSHGIIMPALTAKPSVKKAERKKTEPTRVQASSAAVDVATPVLVNNSRSAGALPLASCRLYGSSIHCGNNRYNLLGNLNNQKLNKAVFDPERRLGITEYRGDYNNERALHRHLGESYRRYIQGMLAIGLAASTMSYSRFYYTHADAKKNQQNFAERFEKMYEFLKKDKQTMGVKSHYSDDRPASLEFCSELTDEIVVCDNKKINWLYQRVK